jgi:hypothetical protein
MRRPAYGIDSQHGQMLSQIKGADLFPKTPGF